MSVKTVRNEDTISRIVPRNNLYSKRVKTINESLKKIYLSKNIPFAVHGNTPNVTTHINYGGLHLITRGSKILGNNMLNGLMNTSCLQKPK